MLREGISKDNANGRMSAMMYQTYQMNCDEFVIGLFNSEILNIHCHDQGYSLQANPQQVLPSYNSA